MAGRKTWVAFEKLLAADVNEFLADQSVMRFATTAARDAAIPTPESGMMSSVAASPDFGAPRYWDVVVADWVLVSQGVEIPNMLRVANPVDMAEASVSASTSGTSWLQVSAGLGTNAMILAARATQGIGEIMTIGTGAAAAEVVRGHHVSHTASTSQWVFQPFGIYVPASTRIAVRTAFSVTNLNPSLLWVPWTSGTPSEAGTSTVTMPGASTAWTQVATSPPIAGGVEVIGWTLSSGMNAGGIRFGLGAGGSEVVAAAGVTYPSAGAITWIPPFFWPPSTRLAAAKTSGTAGTPTLLIFWRESL